MNTSIRAKGDAFVRTVGPRHVAANARRYSWHGYYGERSTSTAFGWQTDAVPAEGKVVEDGEEFVLLKTGCNEFFCVLKSLLEEPVALGSKVRITPYVRRHFDGRRFDEPTTEVHGGVVFKTRVMGEQCSRVPIDRSQLKSEYLAEMMAVVERERADDIRTVAQVLIDAGAYLEPPTWRDVGPDDDIIAAPPMLRFRIKSEKHDGYLAIVYDRGMDAFDVQLQAPDGTVVRTEKTIFITPEGLSDLGRTIIEMVDDGRWKLAKVQLIKAAPRKKRVAASA